MFWILAFWNLFFSLSTSVTFLHAYFWLIVYVSPRYENCLMHMRASMIGCINLWLHDLSHLFEVLLPVMFIALMLLISLYSVNFVYVWLPCFQSDRETFKSVPEGTSVITHNLKVRDQWQSITTKAYRKAMFNY